MSTERCSAALVDLLFRKLSRVTGIKRAPPRHTTCCVRLSAHSSPAIRDICAPTHHIWNNFRNDPQPVALRRCALTWVYAMQHHGRNYLPTISSLEWRVRGISARAGGPQSGGDRPERKVNQGWRPRSCGAAHNSVAPASVNNAPAPGVCQVWKIRRA